MKQGLRKRNLQNRITEMTISLLAVDLSNSYPYDCVNSVTKDLIKGLHEHLFKVVYYNFLVTDSVSYNAVLAGCLFISGISSVVIKVRDFFRFIIKISELVITGDLGHGVDGILASREHQNHFGNFVVNLMISVIRCYYVNILDLTIWDDGTSFNSLTEVIIVDHFAHFTIISIRCTRPKMLQNILFRGSVVYKVTTNDNFGYSFDRFCISLVTNCSHTEAFARLLIDCILVI